jgi:signal transduction histidine kinase/ligand-binding sensor domain-containing protein
MLLIVLGIICSGTLSAQRSERTIFQFQHTGWTSKDGAPSPMWSFAQTTDGTLWMTAFDGLYRFDGIRFEPYALPATLSSYVGDARALLATPDGGLWIGLNRGGAFFLKDGHAVGYDRSTGLPAGTVYQFAVDQQNTLWVGSATGLARFDGSQWHPIGKGSGYTGKSALVLFVDRAGTLWVASEDTLFFLPRDEASFHIYENHTDQINSIGQTPDGTLWVAEDEGTSRSRKVHLIRPMPRVPEIESKPIPKVFEIVGGSTVLVDHAGGLWIDTTSKDGLFRVRDPEPLETNRPSSFEEPYFEKFTQTDGLTGEAVSRAQLEDRDGNLWFSSNLGLDRFRESDVVPIIDFGGYTPLTKGDNGDVWSFREGYPHHFLLHLHGLVATRQFIDMNPSAVDRDSNGTLWMGGAGEISSYTKGQLVRYAFPKEIPPQEVQSIVSDHSGAVWVAIIRGRVYRFKEGVWTLLGNQNLPRASVQFIFTDSSGRIWFGYPGSSDKKDHFPRMAVLDGDHVKTFFVADGPQVTNSQVMAQGHGHLWVGAERGLSLYKNDHFQTLLVDEDDALINITGIVETSSGDLWLNTEPGIIHIPVSEVNRAIADPAYRMHCEKFDALDGLRGSGLRYRPIPTLVESTDGRLWFLRMGGIFQIDPNHLLRNTPPPSVIIRSIDSGSETHQGKDRVDFPAGTTSVQIRYTAPNLSIPERVRFRYKLEGADRDWQDAGTRRQAFYTNLRPGHYRFQVTARNGDGVWNKVGDFVAVTIAPLWYQTDWFISFCVALGIFSLWGIYRIRIWQVERAITARFDERLSERTRMARELHDTFLQTIQGSKFVVDNGLEEPLDSEKMHRALGQVSGWLDQAITEGRAALNSLRSSTTLKNELGPALRRVAESGVVPPDMTISVSIIGDVRELHPIVRDELYRIGQEAIQNAKAHSHGSALAIELTYGQDLAIQVRDNGVGIDPCYAMSGREGHHGLQGMRERAARIQGRLTLISSAESGTSISVIVPGSVSFLHPETGVLSNLRKLYRQIVSGAETL